EPDYPYKDIINKAEAYSAIGKAYFLKGDHRNSLLNYERGFEENLDFYPGINVAYECLATGDVARAKQMAELAHQSCLRHGGLEGRDYWCPSPMVESACLAEKSPGYIAKCLEALRRCKITAGMRDSTLGALNKRVIPYLETLRDAGENVDK